MSWKPKLFALLLTVIAATSASADHRGRIPWEEPSTGFARAKAENRGIMLFFSASW